jgi:acyl carrier protein
VSRQVVEQVFTEILGLDDPVDWSEVRYEQVEGWDSLAHMAIVVELEEEFGVMFESDDIIDMSSFERALEILRGYGVESM